MARTAFQFAQVHEGRKVYAKVNETSATFSGNITAVDIEKQEAVIVWQLWKGMPTHTEICRAQEFPSRWDLVEVI
jgi:hypothetical protein